MYARLTLFEQDENGRYRIGALDATGALQSAGATTGSSNDETAAACLSNSNGIANIGGFWSTRGVVVAGSKSYTLTLAVSGTLQ